MEDKSVKVPETNLVKNVVSSFMEYKILLQIHGWHWIVVNDDAHPCKKPLSILTSLESARIVMVCKAVHSLNASQPK